MPSESFPRFSSTSSAHLPLSGSTALGLLPSACLAVRAGASACQACAERCPTHALDVDDDGPHLIGHCLNCGACAACCPSGALNCLGFEQHPQPRAHQALRVECQRVAPDVAREALCVPCMGGISLAQLLEWTQQTAPQPVHLVDRGGCATCEASCGLNPAETLLQVARPVLAACGVPEPSMPLISKEKPPGRWLPFKEQGAGPALSRRGFFRRVATEVGHPQPVAAVPRGPRASLRSQAPALPARERWLAAVEALSQQHGVVPLPPQALWRVEIDGRCSGCGLCVSVCPTLALSSGVEQGHAVWRFDAQRCVVCRRCEQACPEHAMRVTDGGQKAVAVIHRQPVRRCESCGAEFASKDGAGHLCTPCRQDRDMAQSLFFPKSGTGIAQNQ